MFKLISSLSIVWLVACLSSSPSDWHPTPDDPDPDEFDTFVPDSGGAGGDPVATRFIFPVRGRSVTDITLNTRDPRTDGWKVRNDFATYCADCGGNVGLHPGEDWNLRCASGDACDLGEPVYAAASGRVVYVKYLRDNILWGVVIRHVLPEPTNLDSYVLPGTTVPPISHDSVTTVYTAYLHMKSIDVHLGQVVALGDRLGAIGSANGPHLHFEMRFPDRMPPRINFPAYQTSAQAMTTRGMLSPTKFIAAHTQSQEPPTSTRVVVDGISLPAGQFVCATVRGYPNRQATQVGSGAYAVALVLPQSPFELDTIFWSSRTPNCTDWVSDYWPAAHRYNVNGTLVTRCNPRPEMPTWRYVHASIYPGGAVVNSGNVDCPT